MNIPKLSRNFFYFIGCFILSCSHLIAMTDSLERFNIKQSPIASPTSLPSITKSQKLSTPEKEGGAGPKPAEKNIYLNFENSSLASFVNYMAEQKKLNLVPDKSLAEAKVSLTIRDPLSIDGAWNVFLTVLEMGGFSIVQVGDIYKVIPKDQKLTQPLPSYINVPIETLPDSDINIRYVFFLQNLNVESMKGLLESMLSEKHSVIVQREANGFIITDKSYNIKSAVKLIKELDETGQPEAVVVMKLQRTNAVDVKELLNALIKKPEGSPLARLLGKNKSGTTEYFPPGTRIIAEERTNSLILLGLSDSIKKIEDFIVNHVDTELKAAESPLHIYELQYTDASQIASILKEVTAPPDSGPGQQAARYGAIRGGVKYFKSMNFQVDKDGNRLVVSSTDKEDWSLLKKTIEDLDKPQPQVAVETLFVSINADDIKKMGGMLHSKKHGRLGGNIDFQSAAISGKTSLSEGNGESSSLLGNLIGQLTSQQGATLLTFGKATNIWAVFEAFKTQKNTSILSQPFLTIANKTTARIEVGEEVQVLQERGSGGAEGYATVSSSTNIELEPQINLEGIIRMQININIGDFTDRKAGDKENKELKTNVTMADGQVLVLGGFVKTKVEETKQKTPLLSDIPVLGWLFKKQERVITKDYIFIFISPTIIKPRQLPGIGLYTKIKMHEATNNIEEGISTRKSPDPMFNWFFDPTKENYSHKVVDFANARYQPTTVDIKNDPYYRVHTQYEEAQQFAEANFSQRSVTNQTRKHKRNKRNSTSKQRLRRKSYRKKNAKTSTQLQTSSQNQQDVSVLTQKQIHTPARSVKKNSSLTELKKKPIFSLESKKPTTLSDRHLEERRQQLKAVINNAYSSPSKKNNFNKKESKENLKNFIGKTTSTSPKLLSPNATIEKPKKNLNVDPAQRKKMKQLFSFAGPPRERSL